MGKNVFFGEITILVTYFYNTVSIVMASIHIFSYIISEKYIFSEGKEFIHDEYREAAQSVGECWLEASHLFWKEFAANVRRFLFVKLVQL